MSTAGLQQRAHHPARRRLVLLALALNTLLAPVLSAGAVLRHEHDGSGAHEHVLPAWVVAGDLHDHHDHHEAPRNHHRHDTADGHRHEPGLDHPPPTLVVDLPGLALLGSVSALASVLGGARLQARLPCSQPLVPDGSDPAPHVDPERRTAATGRPTGLLGLLRSSHALLI